MTASQQAQSSSPMLPTVLRVRGRRDETADVFTLELERSAEGGAFRPGQFNMLYVFGVGEAAISVSGDAADPAPSFTRFEPSAR